MNLSNFVETGEDLVYVDDEWQVADCASLDLVALRALWYLARTILWSCATHPWSPSSSVAGLAGTLAARVGVPGDAASIARLHAAECEFLAIVTEADLRELRERLRATSDQLQLMRSRTLELDHELQRILQRLPVRIYLRLKRRLSRR